MFWGGGAAPCPARSPGGGGSGAAAQVSAGGRAEEGKEEPPPPPHPSSPQRACAWPLLRAARGAPLQPEVRSGDALERGAVLGGGRGRGRCGFRPRVPPALLGAGDPLGGEAALLRGAPPPAPPRPGRRGAPGLRGEGVTGLCAEFGRYSPGRPPGSANTSFLKCFRWKPPAQRRAVSPNKGGCCSGANR